MGFFNKKKQNDESEVSWDDIQSTMFAPDIPSEVPAWFSASAVDPTRLKHLAQDALISPDSWFNVETAAIYIGTRIPEPCQICESESACTKCGKSPQNYLKAMTANQDCDVLLWRLFADKINQKAAIPDGAFIFFDPSVVPTIRNEPKFTFSSQELAPVVMGTLDIKDMGDETGTLHFADANAQVDEGYFFSSLRVQAGVHTVVAWLGYTSMGILAPMAVGVYGPRLSTIMESDLRTALEITPELRTSVEGSADGTVLARMGNNQEYYAEQNRLLIENDFPTCVSWQMQLQMENDGDDAIEELIKQNLACNRLFDIATLLRMRGKRSLSDQVFDLVLKHSELKDYDGLKEAALRYRKMEPGQFNVLDAPASGFRLYIEANETMNSCGYEDAKNLYIQAAEKGVPHALGTLTWNELKSGNFEEGIKLYKDFSKVTHKSINGETINCDSNYALLLLANKATIEEAISVWTKNIDTGHTETVFFTALTLALSDRSEEAKHIASFLSDEQWDEMKAEMKEESRTSTGWFKEWCELGTKFIKEYRP